MVESDTLSAAPKWLFFRAFKSVCRAFGRARAPSISQQGKLSATLPVLRKYPQYAVCVLSRLPLSVLHPLAADNDFLCQYYPKCT